MKRIFALGSALVDHEYEISDDMLTKTGLSKGSMTLADQAQQAALSQTLADQHATQVKQAGGGSAANTAYAIAALGGLSSFACRVNDDEAGQFYLTDLNEAGVTTSPTSLTDAGTPTGSCMVLVTPDAERTMHTYLGASAGFCYDDIDHALLEAADYLYIEGYLASSELAQDAVVQTRARAAELGIKTALSFADPSMVNFCKDGLVNMLGEGVDILFCNLEEAMTFTETDSAETAAQALHAYADTVAITLGADGAFVSTTDGTHIRVDAPQVDNVVDTNGAGDNFAGAFMYALAKGESLENCAVLGVKVASEIVVQFGPRLPRAAYTDLLSE